MFMKIAVHQMCSGIDPGANVTVMQEAIGVAAANGAVMYFAPEMSVLLDRDRARGRENIVAEEASEDLKALQLAASQHNVWVHLGSLAVRSDVAGLFANRSIIIDNTGKIRARYDKIHLFDVQLSTGENWRESNAYVPGQAPVIAMTPLGPMGLSICYDMRFPDLYSAYSKRHVAAIAVPSSFTVPTGQAHWHTLLRARAIEAETFVIAAAQSGRHADGRETYGHSLVIDPWGTVLLDMGEGEGLGYAEIDLRRIDEVRAQIPVHANRRTIGDIYEPGP
jgi:deaminated glutathione amidase